MNNLTKSDLEKYYDRYNRFKVNDRVYNPQICTMQNWNGHRGYHSQQRYNPYYQTRHPNNYSSHNYYSNNFHPNHHTGHYNNHHYYKEDYYHHSGYHSYHERPPMDPYFHHQPYYDRRYLNQRYPPYNTNIKHQMSMFPYNDKLFFEQLEAQINKDYQERMKIREENLKGFGVLVSYLKENTEL